MHDRKNDHINLTEGAQVDAAVRDGRFYYEPLLGAHRDQVDIGTSFLGKRVSAPLWISSMTGGGESASSINSTLASMCAKFGLGMGLGSLRPLLGDFSTLKDYQVRSIIGDGLPLVGNLGIAQLEELLLSGKLGRLHQLLEDLYLDGICIHVNPLQEWHQKEGDLFTRTPIETIREFTQSSKVPVIVKEVGQGMGPNSLRALMKLPLAAIEFASFGGTNFSRLEQMRGGDDFAAPMIFVGHTALEMVEWCNQFIDDGECGCTTFIISGGVHNYLDGYYLMEKCKGKTLYGQAGALLLAYKSGRLEEYIESQIEGLKMAKRFLVVK